MSEDSDGHDAPTRRDYVKYGGAVVGGGLLAGCAGQSDSGSTPETTPSDNTATDSDSTKQPPMSRTRRRCRQ
jgi:iron complex transport system substrate-binding protein